MTLKNHCNDNINMTDQISQNKPITKIFMKFTFFTGREFLICIFIFELLFEKNKVSGNNEAIFFWSFLNMPIQVEIDSL